MLASSALAGPMIETAPYYPEDEAYLIDPEPNVMHYEVLTWLPSP